MQSLVVQRLVVCLLASGCTSEEPEAPVWSKTAELSDGDCPDLTESGLTSFSSHGEERSLWLALPDTVEPGLPVIFVWHGLAAPEMEPARLTYEGWGLQQVASERNAIVVAPASRTITWPLVGNMALWGILHDEEPDLVLYDDVRTCLAQTYDVDLSRVSSMGHSGGGLWNTALVVNRSETLASFAEYSGGANLDLPMPNGPFLWWFDPPHNPPGLFVSGGDSDKWPSLDLVIIDFEASTGEAARQAHQTGSEVVRCHHQLGHNSIPSDMVTLGFDWMLDHRWGEASPMLDRTLPVGCKVGPDPEPDGS
ncbi:MAG: hypothetical protein ACI9MC_002637 [Kiritimatiellia bacterium]|jgi:hypothetical protein